MNNIDSTAPKAANSGEPACGDSVNAPGCASSVRLVPDQPPGRSTRKARSFSDEIGRLHAAGYTLQAIRSALAKVGVKVSRSTVHREVTKARRRQPSSPAEESDHAQMDQIAQAAEVDATPHPQKAAAPARSAHPPAPAPIAAPSFTGGPKGEDVAKAYMATQITNPFMRRKDPG
ncbi:helix-turn-helix domain-containing protein [Ideonella sp. 4Y16]|uniref:Helix-turn-helix domain-containing protein n=1 Tax=Ideonella alba TaxID=2824118 RepID=A0A940YHI8_9BURK|nr:helix-turn-helix domain-containing protein [Ideonella alba]MBQ0933491.1 helix-turn-helix domain-containing protein [Ideonella alba]MBQ0945894.1 helix-turn-helix domain-containing protein [Ideonella alba]